MIQLSQQQKVRLITITVGTIILLFIFFIIGNVFNISVEHKRGGLVGLITGYIFQIVNFLYKKD